MAVADPAGREVAVESIATGNNPGYAEQSYWVGPRGKASNDRDLVDNPALGC